MTRQGLDRLQHHGWPKCWEFLVCVSGHRRGSFLGALSSKVQRGTGCCMTFLWLQAEQWWTWCAWARKWRGKTILGIEESQLLPSAPQEGDGQRWETSEWWALMLKHKGREPGTMNTVPVPLQLEFTPVCFCFAQGWQQSHLSSQQTNNSALSHSPPVSCPSIFSGALQTAKEGPVFSPERAAFR